MQDLGNSRKLLFDAWSEDHSQSGNTECIIEDTATYFWYRDFTE